MGSFSLTNYQSIGNTSFSYLLKLDSNGKVVWLQEVEKESHFSRIQSLKIHNKKIFLSGLKTYYSLFVNVFNLQGELLGKIADIPILADWQSGLGIDKNNKIYLGGYRHYNDPYLPRTAYLFKYNGEIIGHIDEEPENPEPEIENPDKPILQKTEISGLNSVCISSTDLKFTATTIENADFYNWEIYHDGQTNTIQTTSPELMFSLKGMPINHNFEIRVKGVNPSYEGPFSENFQIEVVYPLNNLELKADCESIIAFGEENFNWYRNGKLDTSFPTGQSQIHPLTAGTFHVEVTNSCGQIKSNEVYFEPADPFSIVIPNVFTPDNGDQINQFFVVPDILLQSELKFYNRWGKLVFFSMNYNNDWNGIGMPSGIYYYKLKHKCFSKSFSGYVTILR